MKVSGFHRLGLEERLRLTAEAVGIEIEELRAMLESGGLDPARADKTIENVIGTYALPLALGLNLCMNGRGYAVPMAVEEPSVVAAVSSACKVIAAAGGFDAEADAPLMIAQIQLDGVDDPIAATNAIGRASAELLALADAAVPSLVARGGGARRITVRDLGEGWLVVHVLIDCRDAMGANLANTVAEALAERISALASARMGLRILSNLSDQRCVRVRCRIPAAGLAFGRYSGEDVRDGIVRASRFAERDPYRAATHNKGIMNGVDAVVVATGNDWRAIEAGAHAFAARSGQYRALCTWRQEACGALAAHMEMPLALGTVGGTLRVHDGARLALKLLGVGSAQELAMVAACTGVASNFAALRALATDGIQRGHMALHARSVAVAAGARGPLVEEVATRIHAAGRVSHEGAREVLRALASVGDEVLAT